MCLWYLPAGCFNISYNVLQDSATYADMSLVSSRKQKQGEKEGEGGIWTVCVCVCARERLCMSWCVSIKWLTDRQKIDGNHCNFSAILLFSEHVCVLRNMPKITSSNHQPPMMLFFLSPLRRKFNVRCYVLLLKPLCVSLLLLCFVHNFCVFVF